MTDTVLIDANSIGHAAQHGTKLVSGDMQTQAVFGFVRAIADIRKEYRGWDILCLWDGKAQWRFDLCPEYKSNRTSDAKKVASRKAYSEQRPFIAKALQHLGIPQLTASTHEADDLAGLLVKRYSADPDNKIVLMSGDEDWIQLVRPNVTWRDRRDDSKVVRMDNLMNKMGYATPLGFLEGKCLQGDTSDVISGVGGIGAGGAPEFIAEFGSVRKFWQRCDSGDFKPKYKSHINLCSANGRMLFGRNLRLMQLLKVAPPAKETVNHNVGKYDEEGFREVCQDLAFGSILKNFDNFTKPFKD